MAAYFRIWTVFDDDAEELEPTYTPSTRYDFTKPLLDLYIPPPLDDAWTLPPTISTTSAPLEFARSSNVHVSSSSPTNSSQPSPPPFTVAPAPPFLNIFLARLPHPPLALTSPPPRRHSTAVCRILRSDTPLISLYPEEICTRHIRAQITLEYTYYALYSTASSAGIFCRGSAGKSCTTSETDASGKWRAPQVQHAKLEHEFGVSVEWKRVKYAEWQSCDL